MILCVYSDLHANLPAMTSMREMVGAVDQWICLGDSVGLFPSVNEVLDQQRELGALAVRGDHERELLAGGSIPDSFTGTQSLAKQREVITATNRQYLADLKDSMAVELGGLKLLLTHALTPDSQRTEHKYRIDQVQVDDLYATYDYVFFGHTHLPTVLFGRETIAINPGASGFPVDVVGRPSMLRFDTDRRTFDLIRFDFDVITLIALVRAADYNPKLVQYLENGNRWR